MKAISHANCSLGLSKEMARLNSQIVKNGSTLLLRLLLSRLSRVQLLLTPWTAVHQAPASMGFVSNDKILLNLLRMESGGQKSLFKYINGKQRMV